MAHLAKMMFVVINEQWENKIFQQNPCTAFFGRGCFGYVDTFPIKIQRPKKKEWRRATYSGKYKHHVLKVQVIVDHGGRPIYISGPHIGVQSDIRLWKKYGPHVEPGLTVLGDKAYIGDPSILAPYKKSNGGKLSEGKKAFNQIHSWFRASVEHTFA